MSIQPLNFFPINMKTPDKLPAAKKAPQDKPTAEKEAVKSPAELAEIRERAEGYLDEAQEALFDDSVSDEAALTALDNAFAQIQHLSPADPQDTPTISRLKLRSRPDGFGYIYGTGEYNGTIQRVDILPPVNQWEGDIVPADYEGNDQRDPTKFILYLDGEEIARVGTLESITDDILTLPALDNEEAETPVRGLLQEKFTAFFDRFKK